MMKLWLLRRAEGLPSDGDPWLDPKYSTCVELTADGESCVILRDFEAS
jgi:hypothetical protein